jgi:hypothetical protein
MKIIDESTQSYFYIILIFSSASMLNTIMSRDVRKQGKKEKNILAQICFSFLSKTKSERSNNTKAKNAVLLDVTSYSLIASYKGLGRT